MATENDKAWQRYITVNQLELDGRSYGVDANKLKADTGREPRLLAKMDTPEQQPHILSEHGYSLLAITNGSYLLFRGNTFANVSGCAVQATFMAETEFPLVTAGRSNGESDYLDNAFNSGLLSEFAQCGRLYLTIRGRERSREFDFKIASSNLNVRVNGVQIELDGGYEGERDVILVEAKIGSHSHFNLRQLYYPFRHFSLIAPKKRVRTLFFEYDLIRSTYALYEYGFTDPLVFDSIQQLRCCVYGLAPRTPYRLDELIDTRFETTMPTVPQADDLNKVLELLTLINSGQNTVGEIGDHFVFDRRQSNYYGEAAEYLGLISRHRGSTFELTERGSEFISTTPDKQQAYIAKLVINSWVFRELIRRARRTKFFTSKDVEEVIASTETIDKHPRYTSTTIPRRRQTIISWTRWLADQLRCFAIDGEKYRFA